MHTPLSFVWLAKKITVGDGENGKDATKAAKGKRAAYAARIFLHDSNAVDASLACKALRRA